MFSLFVFSSHKLLEKTGGIEESGGLRWELFGYLIIAWVIVYLCIFKGVKSTGKVRTDLLFCMICLCMVIITINVGFMFLFYCLKIQLFSNFVTVNVCNLAVW